MGAKVRRTKLLGQRSLWPALKLEQGQVPYVMSDERNGGEGQVDKVAGPAIVMSSAEIGTETSAVFDA